VARIVGSDEKDANTGSFIQALMLVYMSGASSFVIPSILVILLLESASDDSII